MAPIEDLHAASGSVSLCERTALIAALNALREVERLWQNDDHLEMYGGGRRSIQQVSS